jgi:hypothetical protein
MPTTFTILHADGSSETRSAELAAEPGFDALDQLLRPLLDGGDLEHVNVFHDGRYTDMFVDEIGMLKGLPRNEAATAIYRNNTLVHVPGTNPESLPAIYGTAVLFNRKVWF